VATDSDLPRPGFVARSRERCAEIESKSATKGKGADMTLKGKRNETLEPHASAVQPRVEGTFVGSAPNRAPNHDDIRRRAYEIHLERGGLSGRELADWLQAEAELVIARDSA